MAQIELDTHMLPHLAHATAYAKAGRYLDDEAVRTQLVYIRANLGQWRGDLARKRKTEIEALDKELAACEQ